MSEASAGEVGNVPVFHDFDCTHDTSCRCIESALRAEVAKLRVQLAKYKREADFYAGRPSEVEKQLVRPREPDHD